MVNPDKLLAMAIVSAQTAKLDLLLATSQVSKSALLTKALKDIKRNILVGLGQLIEADK